MPSPFPGMNPYLEQPRAWVDFHTGFITRLRDYINEQTGDRYFAKVEERIYIHELPADRWRPIGRVDVAVQPLESQSAPIPAAATMAPVVGELVDTVDELSLPFVEIYDRDNQDLITVLEMISPSNKQPGPDREQYAGKRRHLLRGNANFVELDLLRGWPRHRSVKPFPDCDYYAMVHRPLESPRVGIWPIQLRDRLPVLPIPLRPSDADLMVDLQTLLDREYEAGKYAAYIYRRQPDPPLSPEDAKWAEQFVNKA